MGNVVITETISNHLFHFKLFIVFKIELQFLVLFGASEIT